MTTREECMAFRHCMVLLISFLFVCTGTSFAQLEWSWQNPLPQGNTLEAVKFIDANTGIAVGEKGTILRTTDGGATWIFHSIGTSVSLQGVSFTGASTGTVVGSGGAIFRTTDGGATWISQTSGTTNYIYGVSFT